MDSPDWNVAVCQAALTEAELAACARFLRPLHGHHKLVSRWASREILASYLGIGASQVEWLVDPMGKPYVDQPISFNLSHSGSWAVLAVAREPGLQLGVDIEDRSRGVEHHQLARRFFAPPEARTVDSSADPVEAFFSIWTLKEAYVKALGSGLRHPLSEFMVESNQRWGLFDLHGQPLQGWSGVPLSPPHSDYAAALVWDRSQAPEIVSRQLTSKGVTPR